MYCIYTCAVYTHVLYIHMYKEITCYYLLLLIHCNSFDILQMISLCMCYALCTCMHVALWFVYMYMYTHACSAMLCVHVALWFVFVLPIRQKTFSYTCIYRSVENV